MEAGPRTAGGSSYVTWVLYIAAWHARLKANVNPAYDVSPVYPIAKNLPSRPRLTLAGSWCLSSERETWDSCRRLRLHTSHTHYTQYTHALFGVCKQIPTYPGQYNSSSSTRCPSVCVCVCVVIIVFVFSISHFPGNFGIFEILPTQPQAHTGHTQISRLTRLLSRI